MVFRLHTPYLSHVGARHRDEAVRSHAALQAAAAIMRNIREEKGAEERWGRKTEGKKIQVVDGRLLICQGSTSLHFCLWVGLFSTSIWSVICIAVGRQHPTLLLPLRPSDWFVLLVPISI